MLPVRERAVSQMPQLPIAISEKELAGFCRRNHIRRLALFGSSLREDFSADSDIDVLVEFEPNRTPGLIGLAGMEIELSELLGGRKVDLNTPHTLSKYFRDDVLAEARVLYE